MSGNLRRPPLTSSALAPRLARALETSRIADASQCSTSARVIGIRAGGPAFRRYKHRCFRSLPRRCGRLRRGRRCRRTAPWSRPATRQVLSVARLPMPRPNGLRFFDGAISGGMGREELGMMHIHVIDDRRRSIESTFTGSAIKPLLTRPSKHRPTQEYCRRRGAVHRSVADNQQTHPATRRHPS